jgi:very-long-chain (3R)-3-hydroxyacyl-CoA dehydratase
MAEKAHAYMQKPEKKENPIVKWYLVLYNAVSCIMWAVTLGVILLHVAKKQPVDKLFDAVHTPLFIAQTLALLELGHSLFGLVRSPFFSTFVQVSSRILLVWGVTAVVPQARVGYGFLLMSLSWSLVEIPRYLFYAVNIITEPPYWLKWLRYSLFAVLYPSGISGEILCIWAALPIVAKTGLFSILMPNAVNFSLDYHYVLWAALAAYVPGSPFMYKHMVAQRAKQLGAQPAAAGKKGE